MCQAFYECHLQSFIDVLLIFFSFLLKNLLCGRLAARNKTGKKIDKVSAHGLILVLCIKCEDCKILSTVPGIRRFSFLLFPILAG